MALLTWNMQGANANGKNIWSEVWRIIEALDVQVACLQESGAVPTRATRVDEVLPDVDVYRWTRHRDLERARGSIKELFITQYAWDAASNRVHLAVVTRKKPGRSDIRLIPRRPSRSAKRRPVLGVNANSGDLVNPHWFFSLHSPGNRQGGQRELDQVGLIRQVNNEFKRWVIAGDYNTEPDDLQKAIATLPARDRFKGLTICPPGQFTQKTARRKLDYAVISTPKENPTVSSKVIGEVQTGTLTFASSDHAAVYYGSL